MSNCIESQIYRFRIEEEIEDGVFSALDEVAQANTLLVEIQPDQARTDAAIEALLDLGDKAGYEGFTFESKVYFVVPTIEECRDLTARVEQSGWGKRKLKVQEVPSVPTEIYSEPVKEPERFPRLEEPNHAAEPAWRRAKKNRAVIVALLAAFAIILIVVFVVTSNQQQEQQRRADEERRQEFQQQQQQQQDADRQRQEAEARAQEEEEKRQIVEKDVSHAKDFSSWLEQKQTELGSNAITVQLKNTCPDSLFVVVRFMAPDAEKHWVSSGWYEVKPGSVLDTDVVTNNRYIYFFAESGDKSWNGKGEDGAIDEPVVSNRFVQVGDEELKGEDLRTVSFTRSYVANVAPFVQGFSCN